MENILRHIIVLLLSLNTFSVFSARNSLEGCVFEQGGFKVVRLNFYDKKHCECSQYYKFPTLYDSCRKDTFVYVFHSNHIVLKRLERQRNETVLERCQNFYSLGFIPTKYILRDGCNLWEYPISSWSMGAAYTVADAFGLWYSWADRLRCIMRSSTMIEIEGFYQLKLVKGRPSVPVLTYEEQYLDFLSEVGGTIDTMIITERPEYKWFCRRNAEGETSSTLRGVQGNKFVYARDTLFFDDENGCKYVSAEGISHNYLYEVDNANVILSEPVKSEQTDTLIYLDNVLYHAEVTQVRDSVYVDKQTIRLSASTQLAKHPTAYMRVKAYVLADAVISDEQIGQTFQSIYMPINFHSLVSTLKELWE